MIDDDYMDDNEMAIRALLWLPPTTHTRLDALIWHCELMERLSDGVGPESALRVSRRLRELRDRFGRSVLHIAAASPCADAAATLIRALCTSGADVTARDPAGNQPLHIAVRLSGDDIRFQGDGLEQVLARNVAPPHVQALLDAGAPVDSCNNAGWQPIHMAVRAQAHPGTMRGVLRALLAAGADPCAPGINPSGTDWHPIHIAAYQNSNSRAAAEAVRILVGAGESPSAAVGTICFTPLHLAFGEAFPTQPACLRMHVPAPSCALGLRCRSSPLPLTFAEKTVTAARVMQALLDAGAGAGAQCIGRGVEGGLVCVMGEF